MVTSLLLADPGYGLLESRALMKQAVMLGRPRGQGTEGGLWVGAEALSPIVLKVLTFAYKPMSLGVQPSLVKLSDETSALASTLTAVS